MHQISPSRLLAVPALLLLASVYGSGDETGSIETNLRSRLLRGDSKLLHLDLPTQPASAPDPIRQKLTSEPRYDRTAHTMRYLHDTFGPSAISAAVASGVWGVSIHSLTGLGLQKERYVDRISTNLIRNAARQSIEFGVSDILQQEVRFTGSHEHGFGRRVRIALYRSLFVSGPDGDELAYPRIAAALGTPWVVRYWQPGHKPASDPWVGTAFILGRYVAKSYWAEFKPEIKHALRKAAHRPDLNIP